MQVLIKLLIFMLLPGYLYAGWDQSFKKTPEETLLIQTPQGDSVRAYLWLPDNYAPDEQYKAVVMAHGCGGAHYSNTSADWDATHIAGKFKVWGKRLNQNNIMVLLVDSFTTRDDNLDVGPGVCGGDTLNRPPKIDPISVRPADIAGGIQYMKNRADVLADSVGVMGFSNGGTSALVLANHADLEQRANQLSNDNKIWFNIPFVEAYRASLIISLYPGCGLNGYQKETQGIFSDHFKTNTDTFLFAASADGSLPADTPFKCMSLRQMDADKDYESSNMMLNVIPQTGHGFDDKEFEEAAVIDAMNRITGLFKAM